MENRNKTKSRVRRTSGPGFLLILLLVFTLVWVFRGGDGRQSLKYGQFKQVLQAPGVTFRNVQVSRDAVQGEIITRDRVSGPLPAAAEGEAEAPADGLLTRRVLWRAPRGGFELDQGLQQLLDARLGSNYQAVEENPLMQGVISIVVWLTVGVLLIALMMFAMRWMSGGGGGSPFSFGRGRHKLYVEKGEKITFQDVAGIDEAKAELHEVVEFLQKPEKYTELGGRIPKGVLLVGPPGTGKTLLARAVAGEAGVPFFSMSGSDFVELFAGVGASRVRDLFRDAASRAPCIVFIDELDALGKSRTGHSVASHEEREQTLNQLLVEMDGFDTRSGLIIMAATNRPEILDPALLRPGRFDRTVVVDRPDIHGREAILKVHARNVKLAPDVNLRRVAALTPGSAGADLANLVNEAALLAARKGLTAVTMKEVDEAIERSQVGLERKSRIIRPEEKKRVAVHESGHALVACAVPNSDPVHKISIIPRGVGVGGYVLQRPENERMLMTQSELEGNIKVLLGGTTAEELTFGEISTGASNDLMRANMIASRMVREFGMSRLGRIYHSEPSGPAFLSDGAGGQGEHSEETAREIEMEVRGIIERCLGEVRELLSTHRPVLDAVAKLLMDKEVIDGPELHDLLHEMDFPLSPTAERTLQEPPVKPSVPGPVPDVLPPEEWERVHGHEVTRADGVGGDSPKSNESV